MRTSFCFAILTSSLIVGAISAQAQRVGIRQGNVYFVDSAGKAKQLTSGGHDSSPSLNLNRRQVVFVRDNPGKMVATSSGDAQSTALYTVGIDGGNLALLLREKDADEMQDLIASPQLPQFSPDGKNIYFLSSAWTTSGAIHKISLTDNKQNFVCAGNELEVIQKGEHVGKLVVLQHRYFLGGGSYDWYWLINQDGTEVGAIGEETENFKEFYLK